MRAWMLVCSLGAALLRPGAGMAAAPGPLGEVAFANSCAAAAQAPFLRGLALLHDFEYADSASAFRAAQAADPHCAIAFWGEAMTFNHPVWMDQDAASARAVLARLAPSPQARAAKAGSAREAAYLQAVDTLYGPGEKDARDLRYADAMAALHARYPDDVDAAAFYALALLGTSHGGRDIPTYMKAAAVLEAVFPTHPHHPGVLHYMIHAYDDPAHAPLGLRAARLYGAIAAGAPHAVHMTSHIFMALGMWDKVIAANAAAIAAVDARTPAGLPRYGCGHYPGWLVYGDLQERHLADADAAIALCRSNAAATLAPRPQPAFPEMAQVTEYADMAMRRSIETGSWQAGMALPMDAGAYVEARFLDAYAAALAPSAGAGDRQAALAALRDALARLKAHYAGVEDSAQDVDYWQVMEEEAAAVDRAAQGDTAGAVAALRAAGSHETAIPTEFGPPAVPKPPAELLGDVLLKAGRVQEAAAAYRVALVRAPGRTLSLRGLLACDTSLGDAAEAARVRALLARSGLT